MTTSQITIDPTTPATSTIPQLNATDIRNANGGAVAFTDKIDLTKATTVLVVQTEDLDGNGAFIPSENFADIMTAINNLLATYNRRVSFISTPVVFSPEIPDDGYDYKTMVCAHIKGQSNSDVQ
ncbi:MAG: hypothetical protein Q4C95_02935 [Planctomycetia bacterium]|nr:hypothetical protein [Planctomycetia bacterium]